MAGQHLLLYDSVRLEGRALVNVYISNFAPHEFFYKGSVRGMTLHCSDVVACFCLFACFCHLEYFVCINSTEKTQGRKKKSPVNSCKCKRSIAVKSEGTAAAVRL